MITSRRAFVLSFAAAALSASAASAQVAAVSLPNITAISASIADNKMDAASAGLDGLFFGTGLKSGAKDGAATDAVSAGSPKAAHESGLKPSFGDLVNRADHGVPAPGFQKVQCGTPSGCRSDLGKTVEDAVRPITREIDRAGDRARDSGDAALARGNQDQANARNRKK